MRGDANHPFFLINFLCANGRRRDIFSFPNYFTLAQSIKQRDIEINQVKAKRTWVMWTRKTKQNSHPFPSIHPCLIMPTPYHTRRSWFPGGRMEA